jgi:hypothetical protein
MNIARLERKLIVVSETVGVGAYDFDFELHFACDHPYLFEGEERCVLRIGAIPEYAAKFDEMRELGLRPVNNPAQHALASELEHWYPRLAGMTPRTRVFDELPDASEIEGSFDWPVFLKGSRQTSKHNPDLAIVRDREHYRTVQALYRRDPILHWQKPVIREFVALEQLGGVVPGKVAPSVEFRSFWWNGECVGWGRYWYQLPPYDAPDLEHGLALARDAASRLDVPFLVVDFAKARDGAWIIIECNDAQESGYVGLLPRKLWAEVLARIDLEGPGRPAAA